MQMIIVIFYLLSSLMNLYVDICPIVRRKDDIHNIMLTQMVLFFFIVMIFLILVVY